MKTKTTTAEMRVRALTGKKFEFSPTPELTTLALRSIQDGEISSFDDLLDLIKNGYVVFLEDGEFRVTREGMNQLDFLYSVEMDTIKARDQAIRDKRDHDKREAEAADRVAPLIEDGLLTIEGDTYRLTEEGQAALSEKLAKAMKEPTWRWWICDELLALTSTKVGDELTTLTLWDCEDLRIVLRRVKGTLTPEQLDALGIRHRKLKPIEEKIRELVLSHIERIQYIV